MEVLSKSPEDTAKIAQQILESNDHSVIALSGDLGSGKTVFTQGLGKALGVERSITSPTFLLLKAYATTHNVFNKLIHIDLYRVLGWDDISELALSELWSNPKNLVVIEWAERIADYLPEQTLWIHIESVDENTRLIRTSALVDDK
ncbi:tRNA (adenosine(37)-N6)-threonylcarbamoyltransferase complex ATPase subunit type 1 TsaE [candidate division WWE3 bacterium CG_4_10_14_0_2_um_filter_41_14]|uniref:tRNA threonylcarbamoyladenosine biosynthesis protein TsaE n=1 Tax=candidate division WWE3 bacterium CG_4_10_14_0_2_um_filter_41_14 TaxID=1975072 RepID=A0A2M7TLN0_UNCKA|nr:MAG: tRNA (adenosine(37)-N6)-threonylcarbamoyltransferase complex ATPase subunit type 1 TsaE [candidate division WWE3 bacterium CG_4_10_14_0_2_um_filter_41_14]